MMFHAHIQEEARYGKLVFSASMLEVLTEASCFLSLILFTFIASFSRSERAEFIVQNILFGLLLACAGLLWWLYYAGGSLWGSTYLPRPLSLFCVILAVAARMNIKGQNVSFGANPHSIGRKENDEEN